jgi:hypothetical protein
VRISGLERARWNIPGQIKLTDAAPQKVKIINRRRARAKSWREILGRVSRGPAVGGAPTGNVWQIDDNLGLHGLASSSTFSRYYLWIHFF